MNVHVDDAGIAKHGCCILYFLAFDLLNNLDHSEVTSLQLVDAVASAFQLHLTTDCQDTALFTSAIGLLRTLATNDERY